MAVTAFPTYAYSTLGPPQVVATQAALNALGGSWSTTPTTPTGQLAPFDPGFPDTDIRLQQILLELRVLNQLIAQANPGGDDVQALRADALATDATLTS